MQAECYEVMEKKYVLVVDDVTKIHKAIEEYNTFEGTKMKREDFTVLSPSQYKKTYEDNKGKDFTKLSKTVLKV